MSLFPLFLPLKGALEAISIVLVVVIMICHWILVMNMIYDPWRTQVYWLQFGRYFARGPVVGSVVSVLECYSLIIIMWPFLNTTIIYRKEMTMRWSWPWVTSKQRRKSDMQWGERCGFCFLVLFFSSMCSVCFSLLLCKIQIKHHATYTPPHSTVIICIV